LCKKINPVVGSCSDSGNIGKLVKLTESSPVKICININDNETVEFKKYEKNTFFRISDGFAGINGLTFISVGPYFAQSREGK